MSATAVNERLAALTAAGTSIWLDQLSRGLIDSGELARMVQEESLRGVTSNPAIFEKSILGSADYDAELKALADEGKTAREIYRSMALHDVQAACDVLRPVYDQTNGLDGYVSWEVAPRLAHDTEGTLEQGRMYWDLVDRPNLMIKIPATEEGLPAIEQALFDGLNINVTLLFSVAAYEKVMEAFIRAMERRLEAGQAAGPPLGRLVLRLARGHRGRQAPRGRGQQGAAGHGRPGQRPRRLQGVREDLRRRALRRSSRRPAARSSARCGRRPASRTRLPADAVRLGPRRPRHRQHDAAARAAGRRHATAASPARPPPTIRPPTCRRWPTPASTWTT